MTKETILTFIGQKLKDAEKSLKCREEAAKCWRGGTNATWEAASAMHPSTTGKTKSKAERLKIANMEERIAAKIRREVELYQATLEMLSK